MIPIERLKGVFSRAVGKDVANNSVDDNIPGVAASQLGQSAQPSANARSRRARTR